MPPGGLQRIDIPMKSMTFLLKYPDAPAETQTKTYNEGSTMAHLYSQGNEGIKIVKLFGHPYLWVKGCYYNIASLYGSYAGMISIPASWWFQPL